MLAILRDFGIGFVVSMVSFVAFTNATDDIGAQAQGISSLLLGIIGGILYTLGVRGII